MTGKIVVMCICCAIGTATGFCVMRSYKRNTAYLCSLVTLLTELKRNISFRRDSVKSVLGAFGSDSKLLKKNIDEYIAFVTNKSGELTLSKGFLPRDVFDEVNKMFSRLGSFDGETQSADLDMYISKFSSRYDKAKEKSDKYGALAVKLGFLLGLGIGILFL